MSKGKKRRFYINVNDAIDLLENGYGLSVKVMNWYQLRIRVPDRYEWYDWYHTQGTLCVATEDWCRNIGTYGDAEDVALLIKNRK